MLFFVVAVHIYIGTNEGNDDVDEEMLGLRVRTSERLFFSPTLLAGWLTFCPLRSGQEMKIHTPSEWVFCSTGGQPLMKCQSAYVNL